MASLAADREVETSAIGTPVRGAHADAAPREEEETTLPVRVALRCRPLLSHEIAEGCFSCARILEESEKELLRGRGKTTHQASY